MLFRTVLKEEFNRLIDIFLSSHEVIAPKRIDVDRDGKPVHQFLPVSSIDEIDLGYETTEYSAKTYFLPFKETLSSFCYEDGDWEQEIKYRLMPRFLVGLHPCDINALLKLDKVLARDYFPSPYYISRRKNTFIVGIDHEPCEGGFCRAVGADTVTHGFDLFLTDLGDRYFVAINSDRGYNALNRVQCREVTEQDNQDYLHARAQIAQGHKDLPIHNLPNLMDIEFESPVWDQWGAKCLGCGSCAQVCPTCYCYGVKEDVSMDHTRSEKKKILYSCCIKDFAEVAGGHNFRPDRATRLKYRYYHQHRGFAESYESPMCVGCNRCGRACLAGINPPDIIRDLQEEGTV
ncbi:hydrogenase [bacterium]|nr:hydrogenase [bacterium]